MANCSERTVSGRMKIQNARSLSGYKKTTKKLDSQNQSVKKNCISKRV
jgi:hypothetical protein